ncbi:MAG: AbrB/MazE/SpoVT family DNA-binding domain-containing protein [Candidatus Korarchaeota archaeon]|nr:AbrB/MazE/SpoVT family DNA-binding domain-containing protein [Candidatus Korarchaeota archaeon]
MRVVKVTRKGQVTLPKEIRDMLEIREGDLLLVDLRDGSIILTKGEIPPPGEPIGEEDYRKLVEELDRERARW